MTVDHPDQRQLEASLAHASEVSAPLIPRLPGPLAIGLDVGLPASVPLLEAHDLDNYAYPVASRLAKASGRELASV
jgi:hypothetical protein